MNSLINKEQAAVNMLENIQSAFAIYEVVSKNEKVVDLRVLWANKLYLDAVHRTEEDAFGKLFSEVASEDAAWVPLYGEIALGRIGTQTLESYSDAAKTFFHVQAYSPEYGQVATIITFRSKFVQTELEKEQDEQKIRSMIGMMPEGILYGKLLYDENTGKPVDINCQYVNQSFEIYEGVIVNSLQGKNFFELYPNMPKDDLYKCAEAVKKQEVLFITKEDKSGRVIELVIYPQGGDQLFIVERDITQRAKAEKALEESIANTIKTQESLARITKSRVISAGNLEEAAKMLVEEGCRTINTHRVSIWKIAEHEKCFECISSFDAYTGEYHIQNNFDLTNKREYLNHLKSERMFVIYNIRKFDEFSGVEDENYPDTCALLFAPIRIGGEFAGVVCFEQESCEAYPEERVWTREEEVFASSISDFMAIAMTSTELQTLMSRTETMMNNLPGMVYQARYEAPNFILTFISDGIENLTGYKTSEAIGQNLGVFFDIVVEEDRALFVEKRRSKLFKGMPVETTVKVVTKDGKEKWFWDRTRIIEMSPDGTPHLIEGFVTDVTEQRRLEAMELANRAKDKFLAHMSHEIRTPMNSIIGFSELAMDDEISPKTRDYFTKILSNSEWLLQIINDLLDISRIESGKMVLENIPFDLHEIFNSCRTLILPKAIEKGLELYFYAEPSVGKRLYGDPTRLRQALVNLLSNAVKFTNKGIIKMRANIKSKTEISVTMSFEVKDSGIGITAEQMKIIFDPFMQAESGTVREYGGSGLGLSITKSIVELMGGTLCVESIPGIGSKFSFELSFKAEDIDGEIIPAKQIILNNIEKPTFKGEVLLCEDNTMNQQVITEHLSRVGLTTVIAENGKIAVDIVKNRKSEGVKQFDLIFMDIHMPVMDGLEAASEIIKLGAKIPIVAVTANIMSSDMELYKKSGMNDCVGKPFTSQELWRCLMKYFKPLSWQKENTIGPDQSDNELRQMLIENFVRINRSKSVEISDAISAGDIKLAHRLAHSLKSNAAQLGKILLKEAAAAVEKNLKEGKNLVSPTQMEILETELNAVIAEFSPMVKALPVTTDSLDKASMRSLFDELTPLLQDGDVECMNYIVKLRLIPGSEELIRQMEDFQFRAAAVTLAGLKKELMVRTKNYT